MKDKRNSSQQTETRCEPNVDFPRCSPRLHQSCTLRLLAYQKNRERIIRGMDQFISESLPALFLGRDKTALMAAYLLLPKSQFNELLANPSIEKFAWTDLLRMFGVENCCEELTPREAVKLLLPRLMGANPDLLAQLVREFPQTFNFLTSR